MSANGKEIVHVPTLLPMQMPLDMRAERIRNLVNTARVCVIEVGRELNVAKDQLPHGEWLPWLRENFGWTVQVASKYMRVAEVFGKLNPEFNLSEANIDASALYLLAKPSVPVEVREKAVKEAEKGKTITKEAAEKMIASAVAEEAAAAEEERNRMRADFKNQLRKAVSQYKEAHASEKAELKERIKELHQQISNSKKPPAPPTKQEEAREKERRQKRVLAILEDLIQILDPRKKTPEQWAKEMLDDLGSAPVPTDALQRSLAALAAFLKIKGGKHAKRNVQ